MPALDDIRTRRPTPAQIAYLSRGLAQPGGKLPLFDADGQEVNPRVIDACIAAGWAEPWFANPLMPHWRVCRLTGEGYKVLGAPAPS